MARNLKKENQLYCKLIKEEKRAAFWADLKDGLKISLYIFICGAVLIAGIFVRIATL